MDRRSSLLAFPEQLGPAHKLLLCAFLLSVTFALYGSTLYFDFVYDDTVYILENYRIRGLDWAHLQTYWAHTYLGHYAPLHHSLLALLYHFSGLEPFGYHLGQVLLHAACVVLLFLVLQKVEPWRVAALASVLFAVHPTHIETVAWVSETKSTLAFFFFLLSFWFFIRLREGQRWPDGVLCGLFLVLSILAKINTVVAPAIFLLYDYREGFLSQKKRWWSLGCFFLISILLVGIHLEAFHRSPEGLGRAYFGGFGVHLMNLPLFLFFYLQMAVVPHPMSVAHMFLVHGEFNWVIAGAWMGLLLLLWLLYRSDRCTQFWGLWFLVFLMPVLQLVPNPVWVADRYLYVPVVAACVLGSRLIFWIAGRLTAPWQKVGWAVAMSAIAVVFTWHTWNHLPIWRNELALWGATTPGCMQAASCHVSLGQALLANGQPQRGGDELVLAVQLTPAPLYLSYLGDALTLSARNYPEAIVMYRRALDGANASGGSVSNSLASDFYAKLARAQIFAGSLDEASRAIEVGKQLDITNPRLWVVEAFLQWKRKNWEGARYSLRTVMEMTGHSSQAANLVGYYWGDAREIGRLLADLHATSAASSLAHPIR